ncbi:MAG: sigma-54-dependent Fis family transcriptional regulator [Phycisphaerae bacterium]|nr:sigma-54-dependent Fis family transcriptional regulator [Phycisphaerae bacterium]
MAESSHKGVLLVVDDEPLKRITLQIELSQAGYTVIDAPDAPAALALLQSQPVHAIITDIRMPQMDGIQFLEHVRTHWPQTHVILMTAYGSVDAAVQAIKRGAYDYLTKPFRTDVLLEKLDRLRTAHGWSGNGGPGPETYEQIGPLFGRSHAARRLLQQIRAVADSERPVLIEGEPGSGKTEVARALHQLSRRADRPMTTFNCSTSSPSATAEPMCARFAAAQSGTLLLTEIDTLPLDAQRKLLLVLEHGELEFPGGQAPTPADVRLLCATSHDLQPLVEIKRFREDLYYRLSAVSLEVPPLRDRQEDIPLLARHFLRQYADQTPRRPVPTRIGTHAMDALLAYPWPGNVRELEHVIDRAATCAGGEELELKDIVLPQAAASRPGRSTVPVLGNAGTPGLTDTIAGIEKTLIDSALQRAAGNQARAAQFLGIPRTTLRDKMAKYGMASPSARQSPDAE